MRFHILGANRHTGQRLSLSVDAADHGEAAAIASSMDVLVARIEPDSSHEHDADDIKATTRRLQRVAAVHKAGTPPAYPWLNALGIGYCVIGLLVIVLAVVMAIATLLGGAGAASSARAMPGTFALAGVASIAQLLTGAFMGAVFLGIGQALLGFRDIARNSWHLPRIEALLTKPQ